MNYLHLYKGLQERENFLDPFKIGKRLNKCYGNHEAKDEKEECNSCEQSSY